MWYDCPNQMENQGAIITTAANNNNSLTGIRLNGKSDFRFPTVGGEWQTLVYDFDLEKEEKVELSLGVESSASAGAANNTYLNIDHLRLLKAEDAIPAGIRTINLLTPNNTIYDLSGRAISRHQANSLCPGIYIRNGKKMTVRKN